MHMSPALNGSSAIRGFEGSDAIEIGDGITFDFYTGLPNTLVTSPCIEWCIAELSLRVGLMWFIDAL